MTSLNYLDISDNSLSARIPSSTQIQSFEQSFEHSRYDGNLKLCGPPLTKKCPGDEETESTSVVGKSESDGEDIYELERWFFIGGATGFATGFWIACGTLLLNCRVRHALFLFLDCFKDWVYVRVVVFIAMLQRFAHA
ncbi:unnamed protein product [Lactuca virosa]|uniref:Leucine-rich repeat-containing N-terminal plant-type domain-containing protein n=1 Tax=Lactuca virosa TaxID=75947 RepID=A0AAU9PQR9_9ASTR|nr:unnamed protein product [Lactuca virosa]